MLSGVGTGCLGGNEMAILRKTKKATIRAMSGVALIEERSQEIYEFAGVGRYFEWTDQGEWSAMVSAYFEGNNDVLIKALDFEDGKKKAWATKHDATNILE